MISRRKKGNVKRRLPAKRRASRPAQPRMHQITFCIHCEEAIPAQALTCFRCHTKQPHGEKAVQVVFCSKCGRDYPSRAMSCHHCGHINSRHPFLKGAITY